jgi:CxxC motif-containing protein
MTNTITHYLCIGCPLGCRLEVEEAADEIVEIRGFSCKKGKEYAEQEHTDPRRMVTTTVMIIDGLWPRLPVRTAQAIPRNRVRAVCEALRDITIFAPVKIGQVVAANILDTGIDVVASRDMQSVR